MAVKVQVGAGTFQEENRVKNLQKKDLNDKKLKEGEQKLRNQCKKADKNGSKVEKKREETDQKRQELFQKAPVVTQEIQELSNALLTQQGTTQFAEKAAQLTDKAKEKEEIEEKLKYGSTEAEVVAEGQAWSLAAGTSGRYLDIVTMHHADVPQDATEPGIKSKIAQVNYCQNKLTTGSNLGNPPWKVLKAEPNPHISKREMRWRIGPVHHSIYSKELATSN